MSREKPFPPKRSWGHLTIFGYDNLNRLTSVETRNLLNEIVASYAYTLNSKGQRTHVEEGFGGAILRTIDYVYPSTGSGQALMPTG
jgi:predicted RNA-binding protein (virulence factor B family)